MQEVLAKISTTPTHVNPNIFGFGCITKINIKDNNGIATAEFVFNEHTYIIYVTTNKSEEEPILARNGYIGMYIHTDSVVREGVFIWIQYLTCAPIIMFYKTIKLYNSLWGTDKLHKRLNTQDQKEYILIRVYSCLVQSSFRIVNEKQSFHRKNRGPSIFKCIHI